VEELEEEGMMSDDQRTVGTTANGGSPDDTDTARPDPTGGTEATSGATVTGSEVAAKEDLGGGTSDGDTPSGTTGG